MDVIGQSETYEDEQNGCSEYEEESWDCSSCGHYGDVIVSV